MKRNLTTLLLAFAMMLSLAACGAKEEAPEAPAASSTPVSSVETDQPDASMEEPASSGEEPASSEQAPADPGSSGPSQPAVSAPAEEEKNTAAQAPAQPVVQPEPVPETPAQPEVSEPAVSDSVDLNAFYEGLATENADNWPMMDSVSDVEVLEAFFPGISGIAAKQSTLYMPMMTSVVAEFLLVEVENEADVQAVMDIMNARISYQVGDETNPGAAWYPQSIESWKTNSRVVSNGNYVMMVAMEGCDDIVAKFNAL